MDKNTENLGKAFAGESKANRKYLAFARQAEKEGRPRAAALFRAAAEAETIHALNHLDVMGQVKSTRENLEAAIKGEEYEFTQMYPAFIDQSRSDSFDRATETFELANAVEKVHHDLFCRFLAEIDREPTGQSAVFYVCQRCGNTVENKAPEFCSVCKAPGANFKPVE